MDFFRNLFDHFRGNNGKREDENKYFPQLEGSDGQGANDVMSRPEMDIELLPDFIDRTFESNRMNSMDMPGYQLRDLPRLFGDFSSFTKIFEEAMNEMEKQVFGPMGFENFSGANFGDMRDVPGMFAESEKTLTGERLRNYYLNTNDGDSYLGGGQISVLNDKETRDNTGNLFINNENRSDFTATPHFKSQSRSIIANIGKDGMAEITTIVKDESGNEERTVTKMKIDLKFI